MENLSCVIVSLLFIGLGSIVKTQGGDEVVYKGKILVMEGDPFEIDCKVTMFEPIKWQLDSRTIVPDKRNKYSFTKKTVAGAMISTLHVPSAQSFHSGTYKCNSFHRDGHHLFVLSGDIAPNYDFETYKVLEPKQPLVLQCNVTGTDQKYSLKWFKEDQPIEQPSDEKDTRVKIVDAEHKLIINKPNEDDIANYTCRMVHSSVNSSALDLNATITVVGRPTVRMPSTMSLVEGEKLVLDCSVNGKPTPEVVWSFGNVSINETSGRYKLLEDNGVPNAILSIDEVIMDDRGDYTCFAKNVANFTKATTYVRVKDKLAALWPFLGICAEVFVLCSIILIYEKKHNKAELEESDTDQSPEQKNTPDHGKDSDVRQRK
ncbi:neuroplastin isoform X1 [Ischnura elegans]|uniref:neuroplastin isoform X1 n=1 Tax=Ischnura elegans TaxID=197161 RepID=UPI001ED8A4A5|nr:neuroplastin isoform X1 [Ischnura elegans]